jgi:arabinogalactan oligomer/maltooligosaccharide transport system substrate-binding protein
MHANRFLRLLAVFTFTALAAQASAVEVTVWHAYRGDEKAAFEKVVASFNAAQGSKGIKVNVLAVPFDAFADKITASVPRGKGADVFIYAQDRLGGWVEAGKTIEPINFLLDQPTKLRFIPVTLQAMLYKGSYYGLPLNYKCITLIYNKKLVKDPPRTTADLEAFVKKFTNRNAAIYGLAYEYTNYYYHAAIQNGFRGRVFLPNSTKPVIDSPENVKAMELMLTWKDQFLPAEPTTGLITSLFNEGKAAMIFSGPWQLGEISKNIDYGLSPLPILSENGLPMRPWTTVEGVYISATSQVKEAAWQFVKYLTDVPAGLIMGIEGRQTPANERVYQDRRVAADPVLRGFYRQVRVAIPMPNLPEMTMVWSPVTVAIGAIARKASTPQAALEKAQKQVEKDIAVLHAKPHQ